MHLLSKEDLLFYILQEKSRKDVVDNHTKYYRDEDWKFLFDFSRKNGLFPAFYDRVVNLGIKNIPPDLMEGYKGDFIANLHRNLVMEYELFEIIDHLNSSNIPAISLKGPLLGRVLYGDIALRNSSCDLDILVSYDNRKKAEMKLKERGYSFGYSFHLSELERKLVENGFSIRLDSCFKEVLYKYRGEVSLIKSSEDLNINIDLHWDLKDKFIDINMDDFWGDVREIAVEGRTLLFPSWENLLFQLTITSIAKYDFVSLKYLYDINRLLFKAGPEFNWHILLSKVKENRLDHVFYFTFLLSRAFFDTPVPGHIIKNLKPPFFKEKILSRWINKDNIYNPDKYLFSNTWRFFILNYIYVKNIFNFPGLIFKRLGRPLCEAFELLRSQGLWEGSYFSFVCMVVGIFR